MGVLEEYKARNSERESRRAAKEIHPEKRRWWFDLPLPTDRYTGWLVAWTALLCLATVALVLATMANVAVVNRTDEKVGNQLTVMQIDQRPWIKTDLEIAGDLKFEGNAAHVNIRAMVKNVGRSPAFNVNFWPKLIRNPSYLDIDSVLKRRCDEMTASLYTMPMVAWGKLLFPGDVDQIEETVEIDDVPPEPVDASAPTDPTNPTTSPSSLLNAGVSTSNVVAPIVTPHAQDVLLSCVYYESRSGEKVAHHTAESAIVGLVVSGAPPDAYGEIDLKSRKAIPRDRLGIFRSPWQIWRQYGD